MKQFISIVEMAAQWFDFYSYNHNIEKLYSAAQVYEVCNYSCILIYSHLSCLYVRVYIVLNTQINNKTTADNQVEIVVN